MVGDDDERRRRRRNQSIPVGITFSRTQLNKGDAATADDSVDEGGARAPHFSVVR
mgnify:CR=1 FL=1